MARIYKNEYIKTRPVLGPDGKPVMVKTKGGKLIPKREPVLDKHGKPVKAKCPRWYIDHVDADGRRHRVPGFTNKAAPAGGRVFGMPPPSAAC